MWRKFTVYGLRFSKTSFWNRMNTGFLDPAVATVLTACGIETHSSIWDFAIVFPLQQCLPLAVLKHGKPTPYRRYLPVATVLTACGIETLWCHAHRRKFLRMEVATVLTACGIETLISAMKASRSYTCCNSAYRLRYWNVQRSFKLVAIACCCNSAYRLRYWNDSSNETFFFFFIVATVLTACGIETYWTWCHSYDIL